MSDSSPHISLEGDFAMVRKAVKGWEHDEPHYAEEVAGYPGCDRCATEAALRRIEEQLETSQNALRRIADLTSQEVQFAQVGGEGGVMRRIAREALNPAKQLPQFDGVDDRIEVSDPASVRHNDKGFSEEKCLRCGWVMGSPALNCQNDDTPHRFPSQEQSPASSPPSEFCPRCEHPWAWHGPKDTGCVVEVGDRSGDLCGCVASVPASEPEVE